ncbi:uncharacterized protein DS421_9g284520 [Arachis hypogaea]|nr:uncharacterized protein DS421_9g284520 [Arachis hypogaea]
MVSKGGPSRPRWSPHEGGISGVRVELHLFIIKKPIILVVVFISELSASNPGIFQRVKGQGCLVPRDGEFASSCLLLNCVAQETYVADKRERVPRIEFKHALSCYLLYVKRHVHAFLCFDDHHRQLVKCTRKLKDMALICLTIKIVMHNCN